MKKKIKKKKIEFSKILIICLMSTYFIVLALAFFVVVRILLLSPEYSVQALVSLFAYVAPVVGFAIKWYFNSKTAENLNKYPNVQTVDEFNQMYGNDNSSIVDIENINTNNEAKG